MWTFTIDGFYSVVQDRDDPGTLIVRARDEGDIRRFALAVAPVLPFKPRVMHTTRADYEWRMPVPRSVWADYLTAATFDLNYTNFKEAVAARNAPGRAGLYSRVWATMMELQLSHREVRAMHGD